MDPNWYPLECRYFPEVCTSQGNENWARHSPLIPPVCPVCPEEAGGQWSQVTTMLCGGVDCTVAILTFLLNNNNLCLMSLPWYAFVRTQSHSQRHYRPHCTISCPKPRKILEKSSKLLWWGRMLVIA